MSDRFKSFFRKRIFLLYAVLWVIQNTIPTVSANPRDPFFLQHLDNRNGLSNSAINHIFQDSDDILWIATWDGLNMYDGTSFHVFNYSKENDSKSIGSNVIQQITEDKQKNIWISTIEGISRYEKHSGKFYNYFYTRDHRTPVSEQEYQLAVDATGVVFCLTQKYGLTYFDAKADTFRSIPQGNFLNVRSSKISKLVFDQSNRLWLLNKKGELAAYTRNDQHQFTRLKSVPAGTPIVNFFHVNKRIFYSTADRSLFEIDLKTLIETKVSRLDHDPAAMIFYKGHYLLAWSNQGYGVYDSRFKTSSFLREEAAKMQDIKVTSLASGSEQILWYGTDGNGIIKIYPKTKFFATVTTSEKSMPYNKAVRAFTEENGNLWIGTKGSGIIKYQNFRPDEPSSWKKQSFYSPSSLDNNSVYALKKGSDDLLYIGTDGKGISIYDFKSGTFRKWSSIKGANKFPEFGSVYAIFQEKDQSVWLGTSGYGLIHLKITRDQSGELSLGFLEHYTFNNTSSGPANDIIYALAEGDKDHLWVACRYGGLSLLDKETRKFKTFKAFAYEGSLSNNDILSLHKDRQNRVWVGTSYGLNWIDQKDASQAKPVFKKLTTTNGLPNNTIHAIEEDALGHIWVSTNKGLAKIEPASLEISRYQQVDGLQSNEFSDGAVWKSSSGHLFFGGTYGFNYFLPQKIRANTLRPNLLVTGIQMGGDLEQINSIVVLKPGPQPVLSYSISRENNYFELLLRPVSFLNAEKCEFAYFLEGNDKSWHYSGQNGKISYTNIPPGDYVLKVKWSNGEGVWTGEVEAFRLQVKQYVWLTWPALFIYLVILIASGYLLYRNRQKEFRMKYQLEMEHLLRQKDETQHQQRLNFFTNIAHEIQTPLTMIMGSVEHFIESKKEELSKNREHSYFLSIVHQHTVRLTYLVQQLMEFRKNEAGFLNRNDDYVDLSKMLRSLTDLFANENVKDGRAYIREIQEDVAGFIDKDKFEKILFNLLSNAFKHSDPVDTIAFRAEYDQLTSNLKITVSNSGCTLQPHDLERLFDRFFAGNETQQQKKFSTGIGLAFTKELVSLLNADIRAEMEGDWIHFVLNIEVKPAAVEGTEEVVITSAPSPAFRSLIQHHEQPSSEEENKNSLIDELHQKNSHSILIVEDKPELRYLLRNILKKEYIIYEAGSGTEALIFLRKTTPDLIISDVMMPDMDGIQLCREVKNTPAIAQIPFIILSAKASIENKTEGYQVGADAYIPKPFHINYLLVRIRKLLDYQNKMQDLIKDQHITTQFMDADLAETDKKFLETLLKVIETNLTEPDLNAGTIEEALSISKMQLYRRLKSLTGMTPAEFIKRIRLKHAAEMLLVSHYTVSEIFYRTGFNNKSYFFREFKKIYQCAPNEYRQRQYEANMPPVQS